MKLFLSLAAVCVFLSHPLQAFADPNVSEFHYSKAESKSSELLVEKMNRALEKKADLFVADIISIVSIDPQEENVIPSAFPKEMDLSCKGVGCTFTAQGRNVLVRTVNTTSDPAMNNVFLGLRSQVSGRYKVDPATNSATVCNIQGVYFKKFLFKQGAQAFKVQITEDGATVTVWMDGAHSLPSCQ